VTGFTEALVVQNANAYLDGLTESRRAFFRRAHEDRSRAMLAQLEAVVSAEGVRDRQYLRDVPRSRRERDTWIHDLAFLASPEDRQIQIQLFQDYQSNIDAYPAWQRYLRTRRPPTLVVWGRDDPAFIVPGAEAYLRDVPEAAAPPSRRRPLRRGGATRADRHDHRGVPRASASIGSPRSR
jgi:pimeloyl-ACP methyl ester carboxylesterase